VAGVNYLVIAGGGGASSGAGGAGGYKEITDYSYTVTVGVYTV
jgi:hypothetical protein